MRCRGLTSASGVPAPTTRCSWGRSSTRSSPTRRSALEAQGATVANPTDIDLSATANEFPALLCEFKTDIATYLQTHVQRDEPRLARAVSANACRPDRLRPGAPEPRGALERRDLRSGRCNERPWSRLRRAPRGDDAARSDGNQFAHVRQQPRRDHRPDERPGLAEQRRRTRVTSTVTSSSSWARRRPPLCPATPTSRCPPATTRDCRSGSRSSAAAGPSRT